MDFETESCPDCSCDYVELFDGSDDSSPSIGRYCGYVAPNPPNIQSTGPDMFIRFVSDDTYEYKGFIARYGPPYGNVGMYLHLSFIILIAFTNQKKVDIYQFTFNSKSPLWTCLEACGEDQPEIVRREAGVFFSDRYPHNYPLGTVCQWRFEAPGGKVNISIIPKSV